MQSGLMIELDVASQMSICTEPGIDSIGMEALKMLDVGGDTLVHLFQIVWVIEVIPKQLIDTILMPLHKRGSSMI